MKLRILLFTLFIIILFGNFQSIIAKEELPDTLWSKNFDNLRLTKFSPDGDYIYVGLREDILKIESSTGNIVDTILASEAPAIQISFSPTSDTVVFVGGRSISLVDFNSSELIERFDVSNNKGIEGLITENGKKIIFNSNEMSLDVPQITIFDIDTKQKIKEFTGRYYHARKLRLSNDGKYLAISDFRGTYSSVVVINLENYKEEIIFGGGGNESFGLIDFTKDDKYLALHSINSQVNFYDKNTFELVKNN